MGMPAARALIDKSAHTGPILSGSPDVIIGGFPAARKGDPVSCSQHGSGSIVSGSGSVFVNGLPLARQGDKTQCHTSGAAAVKKREAALPQYWGGSLAKKAGDDGMLHDDAFDARVLSLYASAEDKAGLGDHDTASVGFALEDITQGNMKSQDLLKGEMRTKIASANATGTYYGYSGDSDITGFNTNATATGMQYGGTGAAGKSGTLYGGVTGDVTLGTAEAKAVAEVYKGNSGKYGFSVEAGAEAAAVKGEAVGNIDMYGVIVAEAKLGASAGSAGASAGFTGYWDTTDDSINVRITGELAAVLGLKGDVTLKMAGKPLIDLLKDDQGTESEAKKEVPATGDGNIVSGCITVLIG